MVSTMILSFLLVASCNFTFGVVLPWSTEFQKKLLSGNSQWTAQQELFTLMLVPRAVPHIFRRKAGKRSFDFSV